jgi:hypothetical protein
MCLPLDQRQLPKIVAVEVQEIEGDENDLGRLALQLVLQQEKSVVPSSAGTTTSPSMMAEPAADVPGVAGDLLEAVRPVVATAGEDLDCGIPEMDLDAVAVELDFMNPARAGRDLLDRRRQRRFDEVGHHGLDADRRRFLRWNAMTPPRNQFIQIDTGRMVPSAKKAPITPEPKSRTDILPVQLLLSELRRISGCDNLAALARHAPNISIRLHRVQIFSRYNLTKDTAQLTIEYRSTIRF